MRKRKFLKAGILAASFAVMVPMASMEAFAEEQDEAAVVAEAEAGQETDQETDQETEQEAEQEAGQETEQEVDQETAQETDKVEEEEESPKLAPAEKDGWVEEDGGWRYYKDGDFYVSGIYQIGSDYYGFQWNGLMYDDCSFDMDGFYYRAKPGGKLYRNGWVEMYGEWYYYREDCSAAEGIYTYNGKPYMFTGYAGRLQVNATQEVDGVWYVSDADGVATALPSKDGWAEVNGNYYYIQDGDPVCDEVIQIGTDYYGFDDDCRLITNRRFSIYDYDAEESYYYRAGADGKLLKSTWYQEGQWDKWHYYGEDGKAAVGLVDIKDKWYLFENWDNGLATDQARVYYDLFLVIDENGVCTPVEAGWSKCGKKYYYLKDGDFLKETVEEIDGEYYGFDADGRMYDNEVFTIGNDSYRAKASGALYRSKWYYNYYYGSDAAGAKGLTTIGGKQYFFEYGKAYQGRFFLLEGELYHADANCVVTKVTEDGFYYHDANRHEISYVSGGKILKNEWKKVGGKYYYFSEDGLAYIDGVYEIKGKNYLFDHDGVMASAGWKLGNTIYITKSGALATGHQKIDNVWYYFSEYGEKMTGMVKTETGLFLYAVDGSYIGKATGSGWNEISGSYYYVNSDGTLAIGLTTIGKNDYYFDYYSQGAMVTDEVRWADGYPVLFKSNGQRLQNGWYQINNEYYYAENGQLVCNTTKTISGKRYSFGYNGAMKNDSYVTERNLVTIASNGSISSEKAMADGWTLADGRYYYYKNGLPFTGWVGDYYIEGGIMQRNTIVAGGYWVNYDGKYQKTAGWVHSGIPGASWEAGCYVKKGGKIASKEWLKIDGEWYYFDQYGYRINGVDKIDGIYYIFSGNGVLTKTIGATLPNGWVQAGSEYYYFDCGDFVYGDLEIKGRVYTFEGSRMISGGISTYYGHTNGYYSDENGVAQTSYRGWKMVNGTWYYFAENNKAEIQGWSTQGTTQYYVEYGMVTGTRVIYGKLYTFNADGALVKEHSCQNGWYQYEGEYYYFRNGEAITEQLVTEKGKTYLIGWDGRLVKNGTGWANGTSEDGTYYADANGVIVKNTWKKVGGRDRYFNAQGRMLTGIQKINGKVYYFD